jgi:hypothetical protein
MQNTASHSLQLSISSFLEADNIPRTKLLTTKSFIHKKLVRPFKDGNCGAMVLLPAFQFRDQVNG